MISKLKQHYKKIFICVILLLIMSQTPYYKRVGATESSVTQESQEIITTQQGTKTPSGIQESNSIKLNINNQQISLNNVLIYNNRTFLKVREITEKINAQIEYVQATETNPNSLMGVAVITAPNPNDAGQQITLEIPIGYSKLVKIVKDKNTGKVLETTTINIDPQDTSVKSFAYKDYTYLPLRAVAEALNYTVNYDNNTSTININDNAHPYVAPEPTPTQPTNPQPTESGSTDDENVNKGERKPNYNGTKVNERSPQGNWVWNNRLQKWFPCKSKTGTSTADGNGDHTQILH